MNNSFLNKIIIFYNIMDNQNVVNFKIKNKFLLYILNILLKQENNVTSLNEIIYLEILD